MKLHAAILDHARHLFFNLTPSAAPRAALRALAGAKIDLQALDI